MMRLSELDEGLASTQSEKVRPWHVRQVSGLMGFERLTVWTTISFVKLL